MAKHTTRTFLAIPLPEARIARLKRVQDHLAKSFSAEIRWTEPDQLHLTMAFLGDVPELHLHDVCRAVQKATQTLSAWEMQIAGLGVFPSVRQPRVLWAGVMGTDPDPAPGESALRALHDQLVQATRSVGFPPTDLRFSPHITLGRFRPGQGFPENANPDEILLEPRRLLLGVLPIRQVIVYGSTLRSEGPVYSALAHAPLQVKSSRSRPAVAKKDDDHDDDDDESA